MDRADFTALRPFWYVVGERTPLEARIADHGLRDEHERHGDRADDPPGMAPGRGGAIDSPSVGSIIMPAGLAGKLRTIKGASVSA